MEFLPHDRVVWITLIVVVGVLVAYGIFRNYSIRLRHGKSDVFFDRGEKDDAPPVIDVASESAIDHGKIGNVTGYDADIPSTVRLPQVDVLRKASVSHTEMGDIVGVSLKKVQTTNNETKTP